MRILLVYPSFPETFWSYKHALKIISKKALEPPLGLLTIAAMLPVEWEKKLIDMNVTDLTDEYILWADYVFISAMQVQKDATKSVISRCNQLKRKTVVGGPLFTRGHEEFHGVDHFVLGEAEVTLPLFLSDLAQSCPKPVYMPSERPDIGNTPPPLWSLINMKDYLTMTIQCTRGCPFDCDFCDITFMFGRKPRTKSAQQMINELDALYNQGWRSHIFIVDDNFIGNKRKIKTEILPAMIDWQRNRNFPFSFSTELSINLADDEELMQLMLKAGFNRVFIGIETPSEKGLEECNKVQNKGRDMLALVKKIQNHGFQVYGGFILGFDTDPASIFQDQIDFIQKSGIIVAVVGLLVVGPGTRLYDRMQSENRLLGEATGDNTDFSLNFIPKMDSKRLLTGYKYVLDTIYSSEQCSKRIMTFFEEYKPKIKPNTKQQYSLIAVLIKSIWLLGIVEKGRRHFWKLLLLTLFRYPRFLALAVRFSIYRLHFYRIAQKSYSIPDIPSEN
jgi:radical SAM superfamily enzyme YgiQ (UPF0313 family)